MNALQRVTVVLERARVAGGWVDEDVAAAVLAELGLDWNGELLEVRRTALVSQSSTDAADLEDE